MSESNKNVEATDCIEMSESNKNVEATDCIEMSESNKNVEATDCIEMSESNKNVEAIVSSTLNCDYEDKINTLTKTFLKTVDNTKHFFRPGLINRSNYCYINVFLQVLFYNPILGLQYLNMLNTLNEDKINDENKVVKAMCQTLIDMKYSNNKTIINHIHKHFADEPVDFFDFSRHLFEILKTNEHDVDEPTIFTTLKYKCKKCYGKSQNISEHKGTLITIVNYSFSLQLFSTLTKMCYICNNNTEHEECTTYELCGTPFLEVNIVRNYEQVEGHDNQPNDYEKTEAKYDIMFISDNDVYELTAVIIKKGAIYDGHWIAIIKDWDTEEWWRMNDEKVEKCDNILSNDITKSAIYLCYVNKSQKVQATQKYEVAFDKLYNNYLKKKKYNNSYYNINAAKSLLRKDNLMLYVPISWLQLNVKEEPQYITCICYKNQQNDGLYIPLTIVDNHLKITNNKKRKRIYMNNSINGNICENCLQTIFLELKI
jgi:hypothetical protein